jgi:hypothetical protein
MTTYTFFQNMVNQNQVSQGIFGVFMNASINQATMQTGGELTLGGYNSKYFTGSILWYNVPTMPGIGYKYFWTLPITLLQMTGSYNTTFLPGSDAFVVFDTGESSTMYDEINLAQTNLSRMYTQCH